MQGVGVHHVHLAEWVISGVAFEDLNGSGKQHQRSSIWRWPKERAEISLKTLPTLKTQLYVHESPTWWLIPLSKWVITTVINGISRVNPLIIGVVITHLRAGG